MQLGFPFFDVAVAMFTEAHGNCQVEVELYAVEKNPNAVANLETSTASTPRSLELPISRLSRLSQSLNLEQSSWVCDRKNFLNPKRRIKPRKQICLQDDLLTVFYSFLASISHPDPLDITCLQPARQFAFRTIEQSNNSTSAEDAEAPCLETTVLRQSLACGWAHNLCHTSCGDGFRMF